MSAYILYGVGTPYVHEVAESVRRAGGSITALVANLPDVPVPEDLGPVVGVDGIRTEWLELPVVLPLITPGHRKALEGETRELGFRRLARVIDPTSVIADSAALDEGVLVNAGSVIGANCRAGRLALVNRSASVGHDVTLEEYVSLGPGCVLCGSIVMERGAFVGAGAILLPGVRVGANSIVGAGAVVTEDIPARSVVVGNPGRVVREDIAGYNDVSV